MRVTALNGKTADYVRWAVTLGIAAIIAYYTAIGAMQAQIAVVIEREKNHYDEIIRRLDRMELKLDGGGR